MGELVYEVRYPVDAVPYPKFAELIGKSEAAVKAMVDKGKLPLVPWVNPEKSNPSRAENWVYIPEFIDDFTLPLMAWLWQNQPDLLLNPQKNREVKFTTLINNDDSADILFEIPVRERVKVTRDDNGSLRAEHLPEPRPRLTGGVWDTVLDDATGETAS
ncbi:hypothetical protein DWG24_11845 [Dickeya zeae]|uniref:Phage tail protein n=2 Tax=Dickeya zeae TaxID=204042 RepID=A0AAE6Z007_9GAMM|nr:hypothetical protein DWG24_11845 [Dickeya zeae]